MFKAIKLLSFDITKTLITVSNDVGVEYMKVATKFGLKPKNDDIVKKLNESFSKNFKRLNQELPNFGLKSNLTSEQWWSRLVLSIFNDIGYNSDDEQQKLEQVASHLFKQYSRGNCWHLNSDAPQLIKDLRLKKPEITLAVASNFDERLETILRDLEIRPYFNFMFVSRQCGIAKPDPEFFRNILKTVEVEPNEYLHIGDDVENDYFPVKNLNANALILDPTKEVLKLPNVNPNDVITELKELNSLIFTDEEEENKKENK